MSLSGPAAKHQVDLSTSALPRRSFPTLRTGAGGDAAEAGQSGQDRPSALARWKLFSVFNEDPSLS